MEELFRPPKVNHVTGMEAVERYFEAQGYPRYRVTADFPAIEWTYDDNTTELPLVSGHTESYYRVRAIIRTVAAVIAVELAVAAFIALLWLISSLVDQLGGAIS